MPARNIETVTNQKAVGEKGIRTHVRFRTAVEPHGEEPGHSDARKSRGSLLGCQQGSKGLNAPTGGQRVINHSGLP
jgi:hypothetical protein